jgi:NAD(P)-dependent dehydrogenase (short-subunit alcohol dehydrogenase family)
MADSARGRVVLITGATGELGRVVAADMAAAGHALALVGTDRERLATLGRELGLDADRHALVTADLRRELEASSAVAEVWRRLGSPAVVLHLVGGWTGGTPLLDLAPDDLASMLDQHAWTTFHVTRAAVPGMVEAGWGRVVAVSSPTAVDPPARGAAYAAGKAAQEALLASLAADLAGTGVTVNVIRVRGIDVAGVPGAQAGPRRAGWTTPAEIAAAIRYLCSDEAGVLSGGRLGLFGPA